MNLTLKCKVSLSKKFRTMIGSNKANVNLNISDCKDGTGEGFLSIYVDDNINLTDDILNKETSIMLTPIEVENEVPNITSPVTSIFNNRDFEKNNNHVRTPMNKVAITSPPETKEEMRYAIKTKEEITNEIPEEFKQTNNPAYKNFVSNVEELLQEINKAKYKTYSIDIDSITDPRQKALAVEQKEMMEAIDIKAYVVNVKCASLAINDLGLELGLNLPYDLSRISAKRLVASKDLFNFIEKGWIKIIHPDNIDQYADLIVKPFDSGLEVYDSFEDAEEGAFKNLAEDGDDSTEEEKLIATTRIGQKRQEAPSGINLTGSVRTTSTGTTLTGNIKRTSHSIGAASIFSDTPNQSISSRTIPNEQKTNSQGYKTTAKKL